MGKLTAFSVNANVMDLMRFDGATLRTIRRAHTEKRLAHLPSGCRSPQLAGKNSNGTRSAVKKPSTSQRNSFGLASRSRDSKEYAAGALLSAR